MDLKIKLDDLVQQIESIHRDPERANVLDLAQKIRQERDMLYAFKYG